MPLSRRRFCASATAGITGLLAAAEARAVVRPRPKLLVLLIAEQFRTDYLDRSGIHLSTGGFRRLMTDGAYFPDCRISSSTFTATGLATLATGSYPDTHGIVADRW